MKKLLRCLLIVAALLQLPARAFTYTDTDLLLVFRKDGFNDVLFNLGTVSNFLGHADGTRLTVSNWDLATVRSNYDLGSGVKFVLLASTPADDTDRRAWMTCADDTVKPLDRTPSVWQQFWTRIHQVGQQAASITQQDPVTVFVDSPTDPNSYTYVASNRGTEPNGVPRLGNVSAFNIEKDVPATMRLFVIRPSTVLPKPSSVQVGSFSLTLDGQLQFVAGAGGVTPGPIPPPAITAISQAGESTSVTFTTTNGVNYRLRFTTPAGLSTSVTNWTAATEVRAGDGNAQTLVHPAAGAPSLLFSVEAYR